MVVYVVSYRLLGVPMRWPFLNIFVNFYRSVRAMRMTHPDRENDRRFMQQWVSAIKGPVDHVELLFSSNADEFKSFYINFKAQRATYCCRDIPELLESFELRWYKLTTLTFEQEMHLRSCCDQMSREGIYISSAKLILSAMPFRAQKLLRFISPFVSRYTQTFDESVFTDDPSSTKKYHYCASLTAEALQNIGYFNKIDVFELTANDVIEYLVNHKLCEECEIPAPLKPVVRQPKPGIVRSPKWVDANYL